MGLEIEIKGYKVLIDDEDWDRVKQYRWRKSSKNKAGAVYIRAHQYVNGKRVDIALHRFIMGCVYGDGKEVDHINHNTLDNRKYNLRLCTEQENNQNRRKPVTNTTGYKGVYISTGDNRWRARYKHNGKNIQIGTYGTPVEAAIAYDKAIIKIHGEFAHTNFPKEDYIKKEQKND